MTVSRSFCIRVVAISSSQAASSSSVSIWISGGVGGALRASISASATFFARRAASEGGTESEMSLGFANAQPANHVRMSMSRTGGGGGIA